MGLHEEIKALHDELRSAHEAFKAEHAEAIAEMRQYGAERAETTQKLERIDARLDETVDEINVRMQKLQDQGAAAAGRGDSGPSAHKQAYETFLRKGPRGLSAEQWEHLKVSDGAGGPSASLQLSDDNDGGVFAEDDVVTDIIKGVVEYSPLRSIAFVRTTTRSQVRAPKRTQTSAAVWVGEVDTRSETQNPQWGREEISTRELSAMADISRHDLEDAGVDLEALVLDDFAEQFGVAEGTAFISGDGVDGKPEGILTAADSGYLGANGIETVTSNTNDALNADDFVDVYFALKDQYARNGTWVLRRSTVAAARKLQDQNDQYIWQPGLAGVAPATILDRPYVEAPDMPAIANGALAVAFGDFRKGYWIVDRLQIETLRDPYTQASSGNVRFWARKRVGGQVVLTEAIKLLEIK